MRRGEGDQMFCGFCLIRPTRIDATTLSVFLLVFAWFDRQFCSLRGGKWGFSRRKLRVLDVRKIPIFPAWRVRRDVYAVLQKSKVNAPRWRLVVDNLLLVLLSIFTPHRAHHHHHQAPLLTKVPFQAQHTHTHTYTHTSKTWLKSAPLLIQLW